ncbi:transformation/transcription domain-associated protein isoform X3 [Spodoptera litura]|uniref:Transformation/transcription domain-associated protein isoform X3 n=1 Tax=Spodoptera litura TaxID=69820 RepID=A0A9J7IN01_SPOLT|nr:transformation/transcription domain-associated protein isoform X3 [Spodoptera litura]
MMASMAAGGPGDPHTQMNTYRSYVTMLADPGAKDEIKLKAAQELSENFEVILSSPQYPQFLDHSLKIFLKILQEGEPHFIAEYNIQQVRKLILEMIHRLPISETLRPYVKSILILMLKLMEIENEENVLVCLKIFMELHKQYRPTYSTEVDIHKFLQWVKGIYSDLPNHLPKIFEPKPTIRVKDLSEVNIEQLLQETYTTTPIHTEKKLLDGSVVTYNLIPRSVLSLKVIQELPIIVVLMYQLYKQNVHQEVSNFIPLIMETITLQPAATHRQSASFNKEVFVDFMGAQIKTLAFLAYIIRIYQDTIANHANLMVKGIIGLLTLCPPEVAHLRKELVIATRHILATDLRLKFVPYMERLFDEDVLLGGGWTVHESLRPLAYSTLADLVHHVRQLLPLTDLAIAAHLFSKNVHDESLPTSIQTMSCKLLLNLVDCIRQRSESEGAAAAGTQPQGRQLLMRILEVFVLKFKTISKLQLPALMNKCKQTTPSVTGGNGTAPGTPGTPTTPNPSTSTVELKVEEEKLAPDFIDSISKHDEKSKIGFPSSQMNNLNVGDYRTLVKTLVCGVKTITWGCASCKQQTTTNTEGTSTTTITGQKQFSARETLVFIRLVRWGLQSLDIYTLAAPRTPAQPPAQPHVRSKEEKEVLEHFSGVFSMMNPQTFQEIFTATISHMVERINKNTTLQIIANTFLSNPATSPIFATVLVEYLLQRMEEMGTNVERSNLYLRLFKLVFGSVSLFPTENEQMLRPHLHSIVNKAMDYAMTAKEPYNYFLLLRALFRSIGGGSHDLLYQEFLPLLPNLLEGLNRLQSGLHKQHMKDLFVELCLTVPVRLSSLLPYLPMLMDPLVSALNGSHTLISQGLRTLELCVDNLQPDFLYEHIQPVRADLMQALWRTLQNNEVARIAFRVLGKFGGGNRKMMIEPQRLEYRETDVPPPAILAYFQDQPKPVDFEVDKVIETAFSALKSSMTDPFYRRQCWEVLRCFLASSLHLDDDKQTLQKLFNHPSFVEGKIQIQNGPYYKCSNSIVRNTHRTALTGMFVAAAIKELRHHVLPTMVSLVRHYTMVAIAQQAGPFVDNTAPKEGLDPLVLVDAIAVIMGHEEKELCKPGHLALVLMIETAATVLGSRERACRLPLMEYLAERMSALCYERAWYAKLGGCIAVKFMVEKMAPEWVYKHVFTFLKAVLFVMMDLTGEVSSGAIDMATVNLERLVRVCVVGPCGQMVEPEGDVAVAKARALHDVLQELVLQVTSPHLLVRQQAMKSLELIADLQKKTVTEVMDPHREVLADIIPPKKHLLRHQPANAQMGLMDGTTFCTTLKPRLFTIDLNINEHKVFFRELLSLCEAEDNMLGKLPCYKGVNLVPLRASALKALAACHYIQEKHCREKIFQVLYKSLEKNDQELQQVGFECMQKFLSGFQIDMEMVHPVMRPLLLTLGDHRHLSVNGAKRLSYLTQLFPSTFSEKLCEQLLQLLKKLLDYSIQTNRGGNFLQSVSKNMENEQKIIILIGIFHQIPAASPRFIDVLCRLIFHTEKSLMIEAGSPFREPLVKFLMRYPKETLDLILSDNNIKDQQWSRFLVFLIKHAKAGPAYREALQTTKKPRLMQLLAASIGGNLPNVSTADRAEMQFQAIRVVSLLIKFDEKWLSGQQDLIELIKRIWCSDQYHEIHKKVEIVDCTHWKEPKLIVKILLHYFVQNKSSIDLLFQLLRALCDRFIPDFQFLREFLENTVAQTYDIEWKRAAFFRFVEHFSSDAMSQELKAKVLQMILLPCFAYSFEKGQKIVGGTPAPYQDSPDNVVSVFINNLISQVIDPENPFACSDAVRISLLQFACLLLEQASPHIHDANNKKQGNKLRRLMTFAWPCLLGKNYVDPATRYHGHLLLSHIIAKFAIHKRIVLQVFHSLLKAHAVEARSVVRQALEILTPAMPQRMEDGNTMLTHWTKKIIVEDGHSVQQLFHILQLVVRHYKVYFPVRHALVGHMVAAMQRLGFSATASLEHRRLAVDLAEVALKWELQRIRDHSQDDNVVATSPSGAMKRISSDENSSDSRKALNTGWASPQASASRMEPDAAKPLDRQHVDVVVNLLLRLACQVNEGSVAGGGAAGASPGEQLSRRCVILLKSALKPDVWPHLCEPKLSWLDKVFSTMDANAGGCANACTALELLVFLLGVLRREQILVALKPLQRGLGACVTSNNPKIVRLTHNLLAKLTAIFPTEPTGAAQASKYEELEALYACVSKYAFEGLATYEKSASGQATTAAGGASGAGGLLGPLMMLKACCASSPAYVDRLLQPLMRVLQRMARDHVAPNPDHALADLLILALDLLKARVSVMPVDTRKTFIGTILVGLIEKTTDAKVMKAIIRMVEEWVKWRGPLTSAASASAPAGAAPSLREKSILLVKLMQYVEKRFPDDLELNALFLELINYVYRDDHLKVTELSMKLEPAFLAGLRCPQPSIRSKFFEVYDQSVRRRIFDRLLYIICSQNWEHIGQHFWIKQCLELLLVTCVPSTQIRLSNPKYLLPSISSVINSADSEERKSFVIFSTVKEESSDGFSDSLEADKEDVLDMDLDSSSNQKEDCTKSVTNRLRTLNQIVSKQSEFLELARRVRTEQLVVAAAQLCHMDDTLAHHTWLALFPRLWTTLDERQLGTVINEIVPFIISGVHVVQRDQPLSALNTFIEALARCNPPVSIKPPMMKYLGKTHNLWHRMTLNLEQMAIDQASGRTQREALDIYDYDVETTTPTEVLDSLSDMFELLQEEDMWSGLWQKHAKYRETNVAIAYEQQGFFEQAQAAYDVAMSKLKQEYTANPSSYNMHKECTLWTQHWLKCAKELNQWDSLLELGLTRSGRDPFLILESSWRNPNWTTMKEALAEVEYNCPKELAWLVNLYRGYLCICAGGEAGLAGVERHAEAAAAMALREWRRLPRLVSHAHLPLLRAAQQLMELSEAAQIHTGLLHSRPTSLHDMKAIVKTWRNRLPVVADPLSHWGAIFTWRQHHYQFIASHYDSQTEHGSNHSMLGVHASAQVSATIQSSDAIIHFAKIARKHNLSGVCLDSLHRIYTIPSVPIVDCFQKIRQQVKCHIQMSWTEGKEELQDGIDMIESTNFKYFTKEMTAEFYAFKGLLLAQLGRSEDANKAFAAAVQLHDTLVKAWALWGDYLEQIFIRDPRQIQVGVSAMTCFLHACRHQNESKSRKYCAKVLWMLSFDDEKNSLAEALEKYSVGVPPVQWLPWIPQLLSCLVQYDGSVILNLLSHVGRLYPQAVYFPIRTLYLTLKIEQRERHKTAENIAAAHLPHQPTTSAAGSKASESASSSSSGPTAEAGPIKATLPMWRCSKIMQMQREIHPTVLSSLEGIVDQMVWFRENWYEEVLRQLRAGLAKCHVVAFHHRAAVADATVTPHTLNFIKKVVSTFGIGIGIKSISTSSVSAAFSSAASESLARRAQATVQDPVFQKMKTQFTADFDFSQPNAMKLQNLIQKLRKWVKILEAKTKVLPKSFLIEEKCRFLSNFSLKTAEVELPGEFLLPKHTHYHVRIARFMPRVEIVQKHNTSARRLYIRGHNGKIYPYLVVNDSGLGDARREERVLQLLRMLNHYLGKQKETSRRFLHFTVPRVVSVSPQMRLVEDNPSSISLLDIYRTECANRGVEYDAPVARYYERLAAVQARGSQASHQVLRDILREVQATMVPKGMLREWAAATFSAPTDYWTFRKMLTLQLSLASFAEYVLHLTRLNPDMMYVHQDSGLLNVSYYKFDVDDTTGELDCNRPVPFRLTPNISELLTSIGITGPLTASAIAVARCLVTPNFKIQSILRTILRDEMITGCRKRLEDKSGLPTPGTTTENKLMEMDEETVINMVNKAVTVIMNRLNSMASFDGPDSKVATLVTAANSHDNLCRMDPAWHPWL